MIKMWFLVGALETPLFAKPPLSSELALIRYMFDELPDLTDTSEFIKVCSRSAGL